MIRSLDEAVSELAPEYFPRIASAIRGALSEFISDHAHLRYRYTQRTEASIIHDLMVAHLRQELDGLPGVSFLLRRNLFIVGIAGRWIFRAKRLDRVLRSKNIPTQQVLNFLGQVQLEIPGAESPTNLQIGYQREGAELATAPLWVTCPQGSQLVWSWQLIEDQNWQAGSPVAPLVPLPVIQPTLTVLPVAPAQDEEDEASPGAADASE